MSYRDDVFDQCPGCATRSFFRKVIVYQCPKCKKFCCDKCIRGNRAWGYKCPTCTFHFRTCLFTEITMGVC
jgi:hypothetical protein